MEGTVTITKDEYLELRMYEEKFSRLESGGVDNWEWYWESLHPKDQPSLEEVYEKLRQKLKAI